MNFLDIYTTIKTNKNHTEILQRLGYNLTKDEFSDFKVLIELILEHNYMSTIELVDHTENFIFGFDIPRIGEEFDLIRLGKNYNINIEIKNHSTDDKKRTQIESGAYYLESLKNPTLYFSFDVEEQSILFGDSVKGKVHFRSISLVEMVERIKDQEVDYSTDIKKVLIPEEFLVNPFIDTSLFLNEKYFLTAHQQNIYKETLAEISNDIIAPIAIQGGAGTGKSLLLYTIARSLTNRKVVVIHSGYLNQGHKELNEHGFKIIPALEIKNVNYENIDFILIDEAQRTYITQLNILFEQADKHNIKLLFFFDPKQTFSVEEDGYENKKRLIDYTKDRSGKIFKLKDTVRSNYQVAEFVDQMFEYNVNDIKKISNNNREIIIRYYDSFKDFLSHEFKLYLNGYVLLGYTSSRYRKDKYFKYSSYIKPQDVVGQEFDKIAVIIDADFFYKPNKRETTFRLNTRTNSTHYSGTKMLYSNVTRAREKLFIAVIDNPEVYTRLLSFVETM